MVQRVFTNLVDGDVERDRPGRAVQVKITGDLELIRRSAFFDPGALKRRRGEFRRFKEISRPKIIVEGGYAACEAGKWDRDIHGRLGRFGSIKFQRAFALAELRGRTREAQMVPSEYTLGIVGFQRVGNSVERGGNDSKRGGQSNAKNHRGGLPGSVINILSERRPTMPLQIQERSERTLNQAEDI